MNKKIRIVSILTALMLVPAGSVFAATGTNCGDTNAGGQKITCENGNPENVQNYGGFTNSQLPHVLPGQRAKDGSLCPVWFTTQFYCVDISQTPYYLSLHR